MGMAIQQPAVIMTAEEPAWKFANAGESFSDGIHNYFSAWIEIPSPGGKLIIPVANLFFPMDAAKGIRDQAERVWNEKPWLKGAH